MKKHNAFSCFRCVSRYTKMIGIAGFIVLAGQSIPPATAGVTVNYVDGCGGYQTSYVGSGFTTLDQNSILEDDLYSAFAGGIQQGFCSNQYEFQFDDLMNKVYGKVKTNVPLIWLLKKNYNYVPIIQKNLNGAPHYPNRFNNYDGHPSSGGVTGSLNATGGAALTTASPAYIAFSTPAITTPSFVPFVVEAAAPGDSLSVEGSSGVIWSQPLANFTPGKMYFAILPPQPTDPVATTLMTYWVHNAGQGSSTVWFPGTFTFTPNPAQSLLHVPSNRSAVPQNALVDSSFACTDGTGVPLPNCVGSNVNGAHLNTSTVGPQTFTVTATDSSGNVATNTSTFNVSALSYSTPGSIWTLAGNGYEEYFGDAGAAIAAGLSLSYPASAATDSTGNVYIADSANNRIRKVDIASGLISTIAGNGTAAFGGDGAAATSASLNNPTGITIDSADNLYVADTGNSRIRRIDALSGTITTVAGSGSTFYAGDGGTAVAAGLEYPTGVAIDGTGNIFIVDSGNNAVRRVDGVSGVISTFAGAGSPGFSGDGAIANAALLNHPTSISLDSQGSFYIADAGNNRIRRIDANSGFITTVAGNGTLGVATEGVLATASPLNSPSSVIVDRFGNLYVADTNNDAIHRIDAATGILSSIIGAAVSPGVGSPGGFSGDGRLALSGLLSSPAGLALNAQGTLYIVDSANNRVRFVPGAVQNRPTVTANVTGTQGTNGWYLNAKVAWTVTGTPTPKTTGCGTTIVPQTTGTVYTCTATNSAGSATASVTIGRDSIKPTVSIVTPSNNAFYARNSTVPASYTCADATSGVASCAGTRAVGANVPTGTIGVHTFHVQAIDNAGNQVGQNVSYTVQ
jgi:sugar lactone lactonase YvrE